jgi:cytochrome P450
VVPISFHDANVDTSLEQYFVPKRTTVAPLLRSAAVDPANFFDPSAFRPERWLEDSIRPHNVSAYMPFGTGPRMCPGRSLALLEMKTLLSMLYKNFDVDRVGASADVSELFRGLTMAPAGLSVRLRSRLREAAA